MVKIAKDKVWTYQYGDVLAIKREKLLSENEI